MGGAGRLHYNELGCSGDTLQPVPHQPWLHGGPPVPSTAGICTGLRGDPGKEPSGGPWFDEETEARPGGATGPSGVAEPGILLRGFSQAAAHSPVGVPTAALTSGRRGWTPGPRKGVNAFPANARVLEQLLPGARLPTLQTNKVFYFLYSVSLLCQHLQCPPPLHPFPWPLQSGRGGSKSLGQCSPREACHLVDTERMVKATARG